MYSTKDVKINEIEVSKINPRFTQTVIDEKAAIAEIIRLDPKKMLALLKNMEAGVWPVTFYAVQQGTELILMDGNRRLTAMKILQDPDLIPMVSANKDIIEFCQKSKIAVPATMPCVIYDRYEDSLLDVLVSLHVQDESKLDWTPLAQYKMSQQMGGDKHKWMKTLLYYYSDIETDQITLKNADVFRRFFQALRAKNIQTDETDGKILHEKDQEAIVKIVDLVTSKKVNTRTPQSGEGGFEDWVDIIFGLNGKSMPVPAKYEINIESLFLHKGQDFNKSQIKFKIKEASGKKLQVDVQDLQCSFLSPSGQTYDTINTSELGIWKVSLNFDNTVGEGTIEVLPTIIPYIKFNVSKSVLQLGESCYLRQLVSEAKNSFEEDVKDKIKVTGNNNQSVLIDNGNFSPKNGLGIYSIRFYFKDVDKTECSKVHLIEVVDKIQEPLIGEQVSQPLLCYKLGISINISPTVNQLVNEINKLNVEEHSNVIACSVRSLMELTFEKLLDEQIVANKRTLKEKICEIIDYLKKDGVKIIIDKQNNNFPSFNNEINFLNSIDVEHINGLLNLGAHKSGQSINKDTLKEALQKNIAHLLALISILLN